jgi:hypothetical protein
MSVRTSAVSFAPTLSSTTMWPGFNSRSRNLLRSSRVDPSARDAAFAHPAGADVTKLAARCVGPRHADV